MITPNKKIALWLFTGCFLIFGMVVIGGITRLTGSGLSITEWKPIMGAIPPLNDEEWNIAFEKYKQIPQFQKVNYHFELSDFKSIFWWEFIHRLLGRLIGVVFLIPFVYFLWKKYFDSKTIRKMLFLFFLGGVQGFIGWYMVSSGLTERTSVSHIRLAIHLMFAFITFAYTFYYGLEFISSRKENRLQPKVASLNRFIFVVLCIQIVYGAFVAGLHAGKIHNTFPLMSGQVIPGGMGAMQPFIANIFDNPVTVQFIHRLLAFTLVFLCTWLFVIARKSELSRNQRTAVNMIYAALCVQFVLGMITILTQTNIVMASLHQIGAFFFFSAGIFMLFHFRRTV